MLLQWHWDNGIFGASKVTMEDMGKIVWLKTQQDTIK